MDRSNSFYNEDTPICRFGPGGDYTTDWPSEKTSKFARRPIGLVLKAIAKMLDTAITAELLQDSTIEKINLAIKNADLTINMEDEIDINKPDKSNAPPAPDTDADRKLSEEPMLFDNGTGVGQPAGHKQNNGVRPHRRAKRKRPAHSQSWQGSLFEPYPQSSKVA